MKLRIFGDSHVGVLRAGWNALAADPAFRSQEDHPDFYGRHGLNLNDPEITVAENGIHLYRDAVPGQLPLDYRIDDQEALYLFSSVLHSAPTYRHRAWREFSPPACAAGNPDLQSVSQSAIRAWLARQLAVRFTLLETMLRKGFRVAVIEPPKPLLRAPDIHDIRPDILAAADRLHRDFVRDWLAARQIDVIAVPRDTYDQTGFTLPDYTAKGPKDPHHGNTAFGTRMMRLAIDPRDTPERTRMGP